MTDKSDKLIVTETDEGSFVLAWFLNGEEMGAIIGDDGILPAKELQQEIENAKDDDTTRHYLAYQVLQEMILEGKVEEDFVFSDKKLGNEALRRIKTAFTERKTNVPWPEWAKTALANGWKAPKNWKPS